MSRYGNCLGCGSDRINYLIRWDGETFGACNHCAMEDVTFSAETICGSCKRERLCFYTWNIFIIRPGWICYECAVRRLGWFKSILGKGIISVESESEERHRGDVNVL